MRRTAQWVIGLAISGLALWIAFWGVDLTELGAALGSANYLTALPAIGLIFVGQMARARSWQTLIGAPIPFWRVFAALNAGYLLNNVLPFRLGEVGRAYLISRTQNVRSSQALSTVLVERVIDLCMIVGMLSAFLPIITGLDWARGAAVVSALVTLTALGGLFVVARNRERMVRLARWVLARLPGLQAERWLARAEAFIQGLAVLQDPRRFLTAAFWSGTAWVLAGLSAWLLMTGFIPDATLEMGYFVLVVTGLSIAIPAAPGNLGVWPAAVILALTVYDVTRSLALSFGLVHHFVNYGLSSALGAIALAREGETVAHLAQAAQTVLAGKGAGRT